jgi:hypothetical protein|tara:strand:- start:49 stop:264 length:216 start_codon:yes stop_codon:yes gene_type:complete
MTKDKFFKFTSDEINMIHYILLGFEPNDHDLNKEQIKVAEELYKKVSNLAHNFGDYDESFQKKMGYEGELV